LIRQAQSQSDVQAIYLRGGTGAVVVTFGAGKRGKVVIV